MKKNTYNKSLLLIIVFTFSCSCFIVLLLADKNDSSELIEKPISLSNSYEFNCNVTTRKRKKILLWTKYWSFESTGWERLFFRLTSDKCPVSDCDLVYDHRHLGNADAIVFHALNLHNSKMPKRIKYDQPWIFFDLEAPPITGISGHLNYAKIAGLFNWTMTYRRDSDVVMPYGRFVYNSEKVQKYKLEDIWKTKNKSRFGVWMVSHCSTDSKREWFAKELLSLIKVDVYGKCGSKKCGQSMTVGNMEKSNTNHHCLSLTGNYMFYLAFENSICADYVTEKMYSALSLNIIPIVFGGADYGSMAPPHSVINALDFESVKKLADYIQLVASNETLYNSYFEWKRYYDIEIGHPEQPFACDLCDKLHGRPVMTQPLIIKNEALKQGVKTKFRGKENGSYPDMESWYVEGGSCRSWPVNRKIKKGIK